MSSYLCEELVFEIFKRLPPISLLRFKSLSKSWCARISSADFIREHCLLSVKSPRKVVFRHRNFYQLKDYREFYGLYPEEKHYSKMLVDQLPSSKFDIVGSCNGIICLLDFYSGFNICLWNPSIGRKLTLTPSIRKAQRLGHFRRSGNHSVALGFGFDPITDDYKAVISYPTKYAKVSFVYTMKTRVWREIASPAIPFSEVKSRACFFNGALHWVVEYLTELKDITNCYILTFNLSTDVFDKISLPKPDLVSNQITIIKGLLGVISREWDNHWIWVMREYNNVASWLRAYKLTSFGYGLDSDFQASNYLEDYEYYDNETGMRSRLVAYTNSCYILDLDMCVESLEWFDTETDYEE